MGGPGAGTFRVGPVGGGPSSSQQYLGDTLLLETAWPGFTVTDYLDCSGGRPGRLAGRSGHYMPPALLPSQLATLEPPLDAIVVDIADAPEVILQQILAKLPV